jgi:Fic family protein
VQSGDELDPGHAEAREVVVIGQVQQAPGELLVRKHQDIEGVAELDDTIGGIEPASGSSRLRDPILSVREIWGFPDQDINRMETDGSNARPVRYSKRMESEARMDGGIRTDTLTITPAILKLIAEIDQFKGAWIALGRIAPERLTALRRVATIESIGSSTRIEGAKLSDREVETLLSALDIKEFASRDEEEVAGYAGTMETVFADFRQIAPTENHIKQLHRDLLRYSSKDERHRGEYKTQPNHVEAFGPDGENVAIVFETASPFDTPRLMAELVEWTQANLEGDELHELIVIAIFIVVFLAIHPFQDGNGRLSRILTTLLLLRAGYGYVPYCSLESVVEQSKDSYYLSLRRTQSTLRTEETDWQPWLEFFLRALQQQKLRLEKKIERERLILGDLPELSARILELCRERGRVTVAEAATVTGANRNTIKDHLKALTRAGHLERHGAGRGTWYGLA